MGTGGDWPELTLSEWEPTRDTLHLWTQIVGKVRSALEPRLNHSWHVTLYVSARGLTTPLLHSGSRSFELEMDFVDHALHVRTTDGETREVALEPRSVADFYRATMDALASLGVEVEIYPYPQEVEVAIPFATDEVHHDYDPIYAHRFWVALVQSHRVMQRFRARFIGKASPVHFFWGAPDLATSRFSGRTAPLHPGGVPNCPDWVQQEAYSHELHSCGFWPGGSAEGSYYAYAYPAPEGFADWDVQPAAAYYDGDLGEFILPYEEVRKADDPDALLMSFFQSTYEAAAELADWNRPALELIGKGPGPE